MKNNIRNNINVSDLHLYKRQKNRDRICVFEFIHFRDMSLFYAQSSLAMVLFSVKNKVQSVNSLYTML